LDGFKLRLGKEEAQGTSGMSEVHSGEWMRKGDFQINHCKTACLRSVFVLMLTEEWMRNARYTKQWRWGGGAEEDFQVDRCSMAGVLRHDTLSSNESTPVFDYSRSQGLDRLRHVHV
jgi:hypothetical protein